MQAQLELGKLNMLYVTGIVWKGYGLVYMCVIARSLLCVSDIKLLATQYVLLVHGHFVRSN